jgi:hypothetical protein
MSERQPEMHERRILGTELLWAFGVGVLIAATLSMIVFTALTMGINPPSNVERVDPKMLHLSGEFAEHNLGTSVAADGSVTARVIATQFMFVPRCIAGAAGAAGDASFRRARCHSRHPDHRHEREHDGGAGFCGAGARAVYAQRRSADAVP